MQHSDIKSPRGTRFLREITFKEDPHFRFPLKNDGWRTGKCSGASFDTSTKYKTPKSCDHKNGQLPQKVTPRSPPLHSNLAQVEYIFDSNMTARIWKATKVEVHDGRFVAILGGFENANLELRICAFSVL